MWNTRSRRHNGHRGGSGTRNAKPASALDVRPSLTTPGMRGGRTNWAPSRRCRPGSRDRGRRPDQIDVDDVVRTREVLPEPEATRSPGRAAVRDRTGAPASRAQPASQRQRERTRAPRGMRASTRSKRRRLLRGDEHAAGLAGEARPERVVGAVERERRADEARELELARARRGRAAAAARRPDPRSRRSSPSASSRGSRTRTGRARASRRPPAGRRRPRCRRRASSGARASSSRARRRRRRRSRRPRGSSSFIASRTSSGAQARVAPSASACSRRASTGSTTRISAAPAIRAPWTTNWPTPPAPITSAVKPGSGPRGVQHGADAGERGAAEQRRLLHRHGVAERHRAPRRRRRRARRARPSRCRGRRSRRRARARCGRRAACPCPIADESGPHAAGRPRRHGPHSPQAGAQERTTRSPSRSPSTSGADGLDEPGALVAEHDRRRPVPLALVGVEVGAADADGAHPDDDLARQRLLDVELLDDERARLVHDRGARPHRISIPPLTSSVAPVTKPAASEAR